MRGWPACLMMGLALVWLALLGMLLVRFLVLLPLEAG